MNEADAGGFLAAWMSHYPEGERVSGTRKALGLHKRMGLDPRAVYDSAQQMMLKGVLPPYEEVAPE